VVIQLRQTGNVGDLRHRNEPAAPEPAALALDTAFLVRAFFAWHAIETRDTERGLERT
jgi:hypothetical protein